MTKMMTAASIDMVLAETAVRVVLLRQDLELHNRPVLGSATEIANLPTPLLLPTS
jgi:hypothetical protein